MLSVDIYHPVLECSAGSHPEALAYQCLARQPSFELNPEITQQRSNAAGLMTEREVHNLWAPVNRWTHDNPAERLQAVACEMLANAVQPLLGAVNNNRVGIFVVVPAIFSEFDNIDSSEWCAGIEQTIYDLYGYSHWYFSDNGGLSALADIADEFGAGKVDAVVYVALDSYVNQRYQRRLLEQSPDALHFQDRSSGFIPGEAAGAMLLSNSTHSLFTKLPLAATLHFPIKSLSAAQLSSCSVALADWFAENNFNLTDAAVAFDSDATSMKNVTRWFEFEQVLRLHCLGKSASYDCQKFYLGDYLGHIGHAGVALQLLATIGWFNFATQPSRLSWLMGEHTVALLECSETCFQLAQKSTPLVSLN